uniref:Uncharacterized protein n=1 Tax=Physcomitrium patens TaxID=3218 RepID=A0A2K1KF52_PHYPA|nr:hypothetical protein PHYPA_008753 [Physcomitrium patens]
MSHAEFIFEGFEQSTQIKGHCLINLHVGGHPYRELNGKAEDSEDVSENLDRSSAKESTEAIAKGEKVEEVVRRRNWCICWRNKCFGESSARRC